ncbi:YadA-like family protein (plasmid) [Burkholderia cenocepacia]|uniref:YadA-like family protein n=1 Tax=Burkholderia cenocepacia TaxID=95486 RepID=UPI001F181D22|nr:YadA-like family protein [Burkholderia cenocepacia]UJH76246.1 YadA-like family protein [Burkholderia cenocepacia]
MNKTYRTVWNATTGTWVAAAETARAHSKKSLNTKRKTLAIVAAGMASVALPQAGAAFAAEADGGGVVSDDSEVGKFGRIDLDGAAIRQPVGSLGSAVALGSPTYGSRTVAPVDQVSNGGVSVMDTGSIGTTAFDLSNISIVLSATGGPATAVQGGDIAIGQASRANSLTSATLDHAATAVGYGAQATNYRTAAFGMQANASGSDAVAVGYNASATQQGAVALGQGSVANVANTVSVGSANLQRRIVNVANGTAGTDAVNLNQLNAAIAAGGSQYLAVTPDTYASAIPAQAGGSATAVGANANANAISAVAVGGNTVATGQNGVAIGTLSRATASETTAVGVSANAQAANSTALGRAANATGTGAVALGYGSVADRANSVSVGTATSRRQITNVAAGTQANDAVSLSQLTPVVTALGGGAAINATTGAVTGPTYTLTNGGRQTTIGGALSALDGTLTTANGRITQNTTAITNINNRLATAVDNRLIKVGGTTDATTSGNASGIAIGSGATANSDPANSPAIAMGWSSNSNGAGAIAIGSNSTASATETVALGLRSSASGDNAVVLGGDSSATGLNSVALGTRSVADRENTVSVGSSAQQRQITNVAAGTQATDAVNLAQLNAALAGTEANPYVNVRGTGTAANATGSRSIAIGEGAIARNTADGGQTNIAIGAGANTEGGFGQLAFGENASTQGSGNGGAIAIGRNATTTARGVALGDGASATGGYGVALGDMSVADRAWSVSVGSAGQERQITNVKAGTEDTDALNLGQLKQSGLVDDDGQGNLTSLAVTYDDAGKTGITLGNAGTPVGIHNVADAALSATSTDAVNGSQLFATNTRVGSLEDSLQNSGLIDPVTGQLLAVTYDDAAKNQVTLGNGNGPVKVTNVADATGDSDAVNLGQLKDSGLVGEDGQGNLTSLAVTYDDAGKAGITLGNAGTPVAIHNVADGALSATSTDVVNGSQLFATNQNVSDLRDSLKDGGVIDPMTGQSLAVVYDSASKNQVTLGGTGAAPVQVKNVADGVAPTDAVNVRQMQQAAATGNPYIGGRGTGIAAQATGINAVALGLGSVANEINTISVGNGATGLQRRITNVQNGEGNNDAATVGQVNELMGVASTSTQAAIDNIDTKTTSAIQDVNNRLDSISTTAGTDPYVQVDGAGDGSDNASVRAGTYGVAIGAEASATGNTAIAIGAQSVSSGNGSVALGAGASATATGAVAFGSGRATGTSALALGNGTNATGNNAVAAGFNAGASGLNALAFGNTARANATDSMAFGTTAQVDPLATNGIAIGRQASVTSVAQNSVALGASSVADRLNSISVGSTGQQRQIIYVSKGTADTDAVNVSQLKDAVAGFGGQASVGADGSIVNPTYTVGNNTYHNVGDAIDALAQQGGGTNPLAVVYDDAGKTDITLGGVGSTTPVAIHNVADGALSATSKDAVNGSQLYATNQDIGDLRDSLQNGGVIDPTTGESLAVVYDGTAKDKVTLGGGATGTTLANVKAGVADMDAVNVSQLKDSGLIGNDGKAIAAVTYDRNTDGTPNYGSVTLGEGNGPVKVTNVADATGDSDALNLGQLKQSGLVGEDGQGNLTSLAVTYDDAGKTDITLGSNGTPVAVHNVADGVLSATSKDAVNGSQLFATNQDIGDLRDSLKDGGVIDPTTGESLAVVYDGTAKDKVTLGGGANGTTLANVKAGVADMDAVNVSQLKDSGLIGGDGKAIAAVTYDRNTDGTPNYGSVTLGGGNAAGPVTLSNVAEGAVDTDAVNYGQMKQYVADNAGGPGNPLAVAYDDASKGAITLGGGATGTTITNVKAGAVSATSTDAVNGSQLHGVLQSVADALGGNSTVDANGNVTNPTYSLADPADASQKQDFHNVGDALANLDGRVVDNTTNITVIKNQLANSGLVDPVTGQSIAAVTYDRNTDGTPNYGSVTLGNGNGPVKVSNVAEGVDRHDAVNVGQLQDAGLVAPVDPANPGAGLASLAVTYGKNADGTANFDQVALKGGANGTTLSNVAAGELSATSKDAVNGSQLFATNQDIGDLRDSLKDGGVIDPTTGESLAVVYDSATKNRVTLGGTGASTPVQLKNVATGTDDTDAVNVAQLKGAGLVAPVDPTNPGAGLASLAVTYGTNADGSANFDQVALKGANGTTLTNVAAGAVNATSTDAVNGSQLHGVSQSVADSLGGGSTADANGNVTNPTYSLADPANASQKQDFHNVGDALANLDGRVVDNTTNITVIKNQLADSGLVDPVTGQSIAAVTYDRNADGTPNYGSVTLGNGNGPVKVSNVADGVERNDAVNVGQLKDAGLVAPVDPTNPGTMTSLAVTYGKNTDGTANFDQVVLAGKGGTTISNVKAGAVTATSTDAINGAQLHGVSQSVADSLGGGSTVDANGNVTNPTYVVNNQTFNNVGDAITNISNSLSDGSIGLVQQDGTTRDITVAKDTDGTTVDFAGTAGDRVLTGVAAGAVNAASNDAINGSQLQGTAQSVADVIGGGTTVDANGKLGDTAIEVNGTKYSTVAEAVQAAAAYGATDSLAVRYDLNADGTPNYGSVTLGGSGAAPVILTNVADGVNRSDAVNFGQLSDLSDKFSGLDDRVGALELNPGNGGGSGGGSGDNPYFSGTDVTPGSSTAANAGTGTGNTAAGSGATIGGGANNATVIGSSASATGSNSSAIGSGAKSTGEGATVIGSNASASGSQSVAIGSGSVATEANTVSFGNGTDDGNRRIVNIADGINANDAASKGQLDRAVGGLQGQINDVSKNAYSGIAAATALTMIPGVDPGKTLSFGVGGATYKGYQAVAFGGEARVTQNLKMKAGVGLSSGGNTVGVGASYLW